MPASLALLERAGDVCIRHGNERGRDSKRVHILIQAIVQRFKTGSNTQADQVLTMSEDFLQSRRNGRVRLGVSWGLLVRLKLFDIYYNKEA